MPWVNESDASSDARARERRGRKVQAAPRGEEGGGGGGSMAQRAYAKQAELDWRQGKVKERHAGPTLHDRRQGHKCP